MIMSTARGREDTGKTTIALTGEIERFCEEKKMTIVGKILYDETLTKALVAGVPVVAYETKQKSELAESITRMRHHRIEHLLLQEGA